MSHRYERKSHLQTRAARTSAFFTNVCWVFLHQLLSSPLRLLKEASAFARASQQSLTLRYCDNLCGTCGFYFPTAALTGLTGRRRVRADVEPAAGHSSCSIWFRWIRGFLYTAINWQNDTDSASLLCNRWVVLTNFVPLNLRMWFLLSAGAAADVQKPLII